MAEKKGLERPKKAEDVDDDPNTLVMKFQIAQQQLQSILVQKETMNVNKIEIERALEELEKAKDKTAYKITGNIMLNKPVAELKKELSDTKEAIEIRVSGLEKTEKRLIDKLKDMQIKLAKIIK